MSYCNGSHSAEKCLCSTARSGSVSKCSGCKFLVVGFSGISIVPSDSRATEGVTSVGTVGMDTEENPKSEIEASFLTYC